MAGQGRKMMMMAQASFQNLEEFDMLNGYGQAPSEVLTSAFEHYFQNPHAGRPAQLRGKTKSAELVQNSRDANPVRYHAESNSIATDVTSLYQVQHSLRSTFGKEGTQEPDIGDHPDFAHLKGTDDIAYCPITTLFMDIEGSTRLGLLYPLEDVRRIKNAFIRAAIEVITSFDGHVHRIMGDAVMAFFGGCEIKPHCSAIDGLNCAAVLRMLAERLVAPKLAEMGFDQDFGIRIGLDYGPKENVLWSSYGYPQSDEVTATSFFVDVAAKLQQAAGRNQIMVGESIKNFLDLPDDLVSIKKIIQNNSEISAPFVMPNHCRANGEPANYCQFNLLGDKYLQLGAFGQSNRKLLALSNQRGQSQPLRISAEVSTERLGKIEKAYPLCSSPIGKEKLIRFIPRIGFMPRLPYTIRCSVENHGAEALRLAGTNRGNHFKDYTIQTEAEHKAFNHVEFAVYRGLHYLKIDVKSHGNQFSETVGVFIE